MSPKRNSAGGEADAAGQDENCAQTQQYYNGDGKAIGGSNTAGAVFVPATEEPEHWTGQRKTVEPLPSCRLRWPKDSKARFDLFDAWHDVAMQIAHRKKASFRILAVAKKVIHWKSGTITSTNEDLAMRAGGCSEKTISRDVSLYESLGVIAIELGWKKVAGRYVRTRLIYPAFPLELPADIVLPEREIEVEVRQSDMDNSGPDEDGGDLDNSGPGDRDNSGPVTIVTIGPARR